ncbi:alpha-(1,3)-fucosyltransferase C-like isoform X2 [Artemia franciscana]|uniref:Fucosyltransferase n=2 Tax=Artemia franciscana TaxID=6661 RepID=A0AA88HXE5_ARTSF|nr:hypothetical protein QYM36_011439 [Artemia franciscana]
MYAKLVFLCTFIFAILTIFCTVYLASVEDEKLKQNVLKIQQSNSTKVILLWNSLFDSADYYFGFGDAPFKESHCDYTDCYVTNDKSHLLEASAIVFHAPTYQPSQATIARLPHQRYVFFSLESPEKFKTSNSFDNFFNWTITYRTDSDIYSPYGEIKKRKKRIEKEFKKHTKDKWVAWMVSNCLTSSGREKYVEELRKHVPVEIYGKCGSNSCPKTQRKQCYEMIEKDYKFYLSFENSLCKDYVTEKLFNLLQYDVIPIVYGAADFERILPANSYINTMNHSLEELVSILKEIGNDPIKYQQYLMWKEEYNVIFRGGRRHPFCELCKKLHTDSETQVYTDFKKWWIDGSKCQKGPIYS